MTFSGGVTCPDCDANFRAATTVYYADEWSTDCLLGRVDDRYGVTYHSCEKVVEFRFPFVADFREWGFFVFAIPFGDNGPAIARLEHFLSSVIGRLDHELVVALKRLPFVLVHGGHL